MDPFTTDLVSRAALAAVEFDPQKSLNILKGVVIGLLGLGLLVVSAAAIFGPARKGNTRKTWDITSAALVALIPGALGAAGIALAFGIAVWGWVVPGING